MKSRSVLLQLLGGTKSSHALRRWINLWPPFLGAGIRIQHIAPDMKAVDVEMKLRFWNANYVGTHFGGSLFAMTDAMYMLMLLHVLGRGYYVWDKQASIDYLKPGRGIVTARFRLEDAALADILAHTATGEKYLPQFPVDITDQQGDVVARVLRTLYIKKKPPKP